MNNSPFHQNILELILAHAWQNAQTRLEKRLARHPTEALSLRLMARIHLQKGLFSEACHLLDKAIKNRGGMDARIERALLVPPIPESDAMIGQIRARMLYDIKILIKSGQQISGPLKMIHIPAFYLAYQGRNDLELQRGIADLLRSAAPSLDFIAPHCHNPVVPLNRKIKLGLCSNNLRKNSVGLFFLGFVQALPRQDFELYLFRAPAGNSDNVTRQYIEATDYDTLLSPSLGTARGQIAEKALDILFYPDLTVHPLVNFLAHARLAPVQMTSWGHPVTSGLPQMDYYISSQLMETGESRNHYSEQVVELSSLPCCYTPPRLISSPVQRNHFNLPEDAHLYFCGHQAFKLHPDFDTLLGNILRKDPDGLLILINGWGEPNHGRLLESRITSANPDVADRIKLFGRLSYIQYLAMADLADVHLDPIWFGGGRTSFDLLSNGNIIITWPGPFQRGRVTAACLRRMDVEECIASDWDDYVNIAVKFGNDPTLRGKTRDKLRKNAHRIFDHQRFVDEITLFMKKASATATNSET